MSDFIDLASLISQQVSQIETLKKQAWELKDMLNAIYENDSTYQAHDLAVKEASKVRNGTKKQIQKLPQAADLVARVQDLKSQITELNKALSEYLNDYQKTTGSFQVETADGVVRDIVYTAKLVKK